MTEEKIKAGAELMVQLKEAEFKFNKLQRISKSCGLSITISGAPISRRELLDYKFFNKKEIAKSIIEEEMVDIQKHIIKIKEEISAL